MRMLELMFCQAVTNGWKTNEAWRWDGGNQQTSVPPPLYRRHAVGDKNQACAKERCRNHPSRPFLRLGVSTTTANVSRDRHRHH